MAQERNLGNRLQLVAPELLTTDVWLPTLTTMDRASLSERLRRELFQVGDLALLAITLGQTQQAVNWLALGFFCDQSVAREALATSGALRASKYRYRTNHLLKALAALEAAAADLSLSTEVLEYFASMKVLAKLAPAVGHMDHTLRQFLKRHANTALKSVVARMDALFMIAHEADHTGSTKDIATYPKEELAEGASYIIHCIDDEIGIRDAHFGMALETKISRGLFDKMLVRACKIRRHSDAELLVDAFNYRCRLDGRTIVVSASTPELEKSIRLGYVQDEQARDQDRVPSGGVARR
jgi:menaquinone-dependent protoporphyrinogen IX oxidase